MRKRRGAVLTAAGTMIFVLLGAACRDVATPPSATAAEVSTEAETWSPEKADLLFVSNRDGNSEIYILRGSSSEWVNLTRDPAGDNWPEWSPDGRRIAFQSRRTGNLDIWVMNADGSDPVRLTDDPEHDYLPSWSPDGERITFTSWRSEPGDAERANHIYVMNADGSDPHRLFPESPDTSAGVVSSSDGSFFVATRKIGEQGSDVFLVEPDGEIRARLTDDEASNGAPALSPDGSRIAFYAETEAGSELVLVNLDGSGRRSLATGRRSWYPRWSPDGKWLVYTAAKPGGDDADLDVLAIPVDGGEPLLLAGGPNRESEGRWSPQP
ncbi:MAG: hypothetical protein OES32_08185 [Acidobacteriota bacterium]|nr:hypothetical protein [Acidobacteriota bacterium]MDH3523552.1 hypothetical protein [Acidobacteriota bacterium]